MSPQHVILLILAVNWLIVWFCSTFENPPASKALKHFPIHSSFEPLTEISSSMLFLTPISILVDLD